jgi:hypothetical protein
VYELSRLIVSLYSLIRDLINLKPNGEKTMRRSASDIIHDLERRIARLERQASTIRPSFVSNRESVLRSFEDKITPIIERMGLGESLDRNLVSIEVTSSEDRFNFLVSFNHQEFSFSHEFPEQIAFSYLFVLDSDGRVVSSTRKSGREIDLNDYLRHWELYNPRRKGDHVKVSINLS